MMDSHELIIDYFDEVYPHKKYVSGVSSISKATKKHFGDLKEIKVLDLCTGTGRALSLFNNDSRFKLTGIDISDKMLSKARENYPKINFIKDNIINPLDQRWTQGNFHCVLMTSGSIQLFDQLERKRIFKIVKELIVEKGIFIFDVFSKPLECENVFVKKVIENNDYQIIIIYNRIPKTPPEPSKQFVYKIKTRMGLEPIMSSGVVDYYNISVDDIYCEIKNEGFHPNFLRTKKDSTIFLLAEY